MLADGSIVSAEVAVVVADAVAEPALLLLEELEVGMNLDGPIKSFDWELDMQ